MNENKLIDKNAKIDPTSIIYPNVVIKGNTVIGSNCIITPGTYLENAIIGDNVTIYSSYIIDSTVENNIKIGPYSTISDHSTIKCQTKVGPYCEVKRTILDTGSKIPHLSHIADAEIGKNVNIGAGTVIANYNGITKEKTIIKDNVFIGSNSTLIAPLTIEQNSLIAAGSTINQSVPEYSLAIARNRQTTKNNYYKKDVI